jgi:hypothetical protein
MILTQLMKNKDNLQKLKKELDNRMADQKAEPAQSGEPSAEQTPET